MWPQYVRGVYLLGNGVKLESDVVQVTEPMHEGLFQMQLEVDGSPRKNTFTEITQFSGKKLGSFIF